MDRVCYLLFGFDKLFYLQYVLLAMVLFALLKRTLTTSFLTVLIILSYTLVCFLKIVRNDPFFLSDDFAHLNLVTTYSYGEIARMALFPPGIWVGHRIIAAFWLFKAVFDVVGPNPVAYVFVIFVLNAINIQLFYKLISQLIKNNYVTVLVSFLFATMYLSWISNSHELLGGFFVLLTALFWLKYLHKAKTRYYVGSLATYILALFSKEITLFLPCVLLIVMLQFKSGVSLALAKKRWVKLVPFFGLFVLYFLVFASGFLSYFGIASGAGYNMTFSLPLILHNLLSYFITLIPGVNPTLAISIYITALILSAFNQKTWKAIMFFGLFLLFLFPALMFSGRTAFYYLYIPSMFFLISFGFILEWGYALIGCLNTSSFSKKLLISVMSVLVIFGLFAVNRKFMDNCFLIQYPWKNQTRVTLNVFLNRVRNTTTNANFPLVLTLLKQEETDLSEILTNDLLDDFYSAKYRPALKFSYSSGKVTINANESK